MRINQQMPNLFILGVQKAGTTSLHNWLSKHVEIYSNENLKDVDFFLNPKRKNDPGFHLKNYIKTFNNQKILLQTHVNYILYEKALQQIKKACGNNPKFILVLRDPVDRAKSAYKYFVKVLRETREPEQALIYEPCEIIDYSVANNDFTYIEHGFYFKQLQVYEKYFSMDNLLIINFEDIINKPENVVAKVFKFVGVDPDFIPSFKKLNVTGAVKHKKLQEALYKSSKIKTFFIKVIDPVFNFKQRRKLKQWIMEYNTSIGDSDISFDRKIDEYLFEQFRHDLQKLVTNYQLKFVANWIGKYEKRNLSNYNQDFKK